ncbi:MAG: GtrA family protein [Gammaproteobacteria bacterium]
MPEPAPMRRLIREIGGYGLASAVGLGTDMALLALLVTVFHLHYLAAASISFICGGAAVYALSVRWVFGHRRVNSRALEFSSFIVLGLAGLLVNAAVMHVAITTLALNFMLGKLLAAASRSARTSCCGSTFYFARCAPVLAGQLAGKCEMKTAIIVGGGPAGLTAALELLQRSDVRPIVFEADKQVGGISKTINYRGNRMDLGGHRFFSKSDWVMNWWQNLLPVAQEGADEAAAAGIELAYHGKRTNLSPGTERSVDPDRVMLVRSRLSRIFYRRSFFDYPLKLNGSTLGNLGALYTAQIGASYLRARLAPRSPEATLEDFLVNRFGDKLYRTFFKDYTEKVWGVPCSEISAEWGAQRIKGLSISKAVLNALSKPFRSSADTRQKGTETSLIERFLYPKLGPGQMWEEATCRVMRQVAKCACGTKWWRSTHETTASRQWTCKTSTRVRCVASNVTTSSRPCR